MWKYLIVVLVVGTSWSFLFHPYIEDPKYLFTTEDVRDHVAIKKAIDQLGVHRSAIPEIVDIASIVRLGSDETGMVNGERSVQDREKRISQIMPYLNGADFGVLFWRPFNMACAWVGMLCVCFIVLYFVFQYSIDPPQGAYVKKIVWCLLPYCCLGALHFYAYTQVVRWERLQSIIDLGWCLSSANLIVLFLIFSLRLNFIQLVERHYYAWRLMSDARRITRWRDTFDNWVLRKFMIP